MTSNALWVPLIWLLIITSRNVSEWFGGGLRVEKPGDYLEGSPFDRNIYLALEVVGFVILMRRRVNWQTLFRSNTFLFALMLYYAISVVWSDYPFVAFKRWIKDLGNVIMVLIIFTESDPMQATRAMLARCMYVVVPYSVLVIKFYGELGRYLSSTWENLFRGVAQEKNSLGCLAFFSGMFIVWDYLNARRDAAYPKDRHDVISRGALMLMVFWLLRRADSSTAEVCLLLGSGLIFILQGKFGRRHIKRLGTYTISCLAVVAIIVVTPAIYQPFLEFMGEDATLTGRTELWSELVKEPINPLVGTGYQSFWLGPRAEYFWSKWNFRPNQAHNGWLETYLNGGTVGLTLLTLLIASTGAALKRGILAGAGFEILLFSLFAVTIFYNLTEAMFNKMSPLWFFFILATFCRFYKERERKGTHGQASPPAVTATA